MILIVDDVDMLDVLHNNPDPSCLSCNACGYVSEKKEEIYWDGCLDCMGYCE